MDIERLKELSEYTSNLCFIALSKLTDKNARENVVAYGEGVKRLIDEAIARQSVTSEDYWKGLREEFMDNLRGCDTVTISLSGFGSTDYSTQDIHNMMMALEDRVVAKSATSEEVAEAIEWQVSLKDYHQNKWEKAEPEWQQEPGAQAQHNEMIKAINLAITALQAYQPVAISKTETTSCEWCEGGIDTASLMDADMMMRFVRPVNFCPNCGGKLEG